VISKSHLLEIFKRYDKDKFGFLNVDESKEALAELGLDEGEVSKCLMKLDSDRDGRFNRQEWLKVSEILSFTKGSHALAKYHNHLTGWLLDYALKRDREETAAAEWNKLSIKRDLSLLTSGRVDSIAWTLLKELEICGSWDQLRSVRELLLFSSTSALASLEPTFAAKLLEKIHLIAQVAVEVGKPDFTAGIGTAPFSRSFTTGTLFGVGK
jgi:hypothetical protein